MIRFFKYLKPIEYLFLVLLLAFLAVQVYCDVTMPVYTAEMVTQMQSGESASAIFRTGGIMLIYATISIAGTVAQTFLSARISTGLSERLRGKVFDKAFSLSARDLGRFSTASLLTRTTNDVQQVCSVIVLTLRLGLGAPLMAVLAIVRIAQSGGELTISTAIGVTVLVIGMLVIMLVVMPKFALVQKLTDKLNGVTRENLTGIRVVRAYNAEKYQEEKFDEVNGQLTKTNLFTGRMTAILHPLISLVSYGVTLSIYWLGCWIIIRDNNPEFFPTMFAFVQLASQVIMAFMVILMLLSWLPRGRISAKRIHEVLNCKSEIQEPVAYTDFNEEGTVEFNNVSFGYAGGDKDVLSNISFKAEKGQTIAIIGATGCGKTTMLNLIERFYDCTSGEVKVNGVNVKELTNSQIHSVIGYVPQKSVLFSGDIKSNIAFTDEEVSEEYIIMSAKIACADAFINRLENGYDSVVSQGGKNFSGGQKQRISIARAVYKKPQIFLFDDSFSALDYKTDKEVRSNLKIHLPEATKIVVAQRIGTVMDADMIIVLDGGKAVGIGTHKELLKTCEVYKKIALSQLSEEELAL